jgi:hypothetical protein
MIRRMPSSHSSLVSAVGIRTSQFLRHGKREMGHQTSLKSCSENGTARGRMYWLGLEV